MSLNKWHISNQPSENNMKSVINPTQSLIGVDFSGDERRTFLKKLQSQTRFRRCRAPAIKQDCLIGRDVSKADPRSVKAYLDGRRSWRVTWWNVNRRLYELAQPSAVLEEIMYSFHKRHHSITIAWIEHWQEIAESYHLLDRHGVYKGMPLLIKRGKDRMRSEHR